MEVTHAPVNTQGVPVWLLGVEVSVHWWLGLEKGLRMGFWKASCRL